MRSISFIETESPNIRGTFTKVSNLEPYGLEVLAAEAQRDGFNVKVYQQNGADNQQFYDKVSKNPSEIYAFSCMTFNYDSAVSVAEKIKKNDSKSRIVFGGPYVGSNPRGLTKALNEGIIDFGIRGEADHSFSKLIQSISNPDTEVPGLIYLANGGIVINPMDERIKDLDSLPFALRDKEILKRTSVGNLMYPAVSDQTSAILTAYSRGCPFDCSYCDSRHTWGRNVVWRSPKNLVEELEKCKEDFGTNMVFFSDLTFNANPKKVYELCDEMIERDLGINWYVLARPATPNGESPLFDQKLLEKMYRAGCRKMALGFEGGATGEIQKDMNKKASIGILSEVVNQAHNVGMFVKGAMILGDPKHESYKTIDATLGALKEIKFDEIRTSFLTAFPGSELYQQAKEEGILLTDDLSRFTTDEPNLKCRNLTPEELVASREKLYRDYYGSEEYEELVENQTRRFPELEKSYSEYMEFLKNKGVIQ